MSRRQSEKADSLEMLLDTMCNAFGGLILIAILIAILARPQTPDGADPDVELVKVEIEAKTPTAEDLKAEEEGLQAQADKVDPSVKDLVEQEKQVRLEIAAKTNTLRNLAATPEELEKVRNKLDAQKKNNQDKAGDIADANKELEAARAKIQHAFKGEPVTVRAPRSRGTKKKPVYLVIRDGKFWASDLFKNGKAVYNEIAFDIRRDRSGQPVSQTLKPTSGLLVGKSKAAIQRSKIWFYFSNGFPKQSYYAYVWVTKNSFTEFRFLKELLVSNGIEYNWKPVPDDFKTFHFGGFDPGIQ